MKTVGPNHSNVALTYLNLSYAYESKLDKKQAIICAAMALGLSTKLLGASHPNSKISAKRLNKLTAK